MPTKSKNTENLHIQVANRIAALRSEQNLTLSELAKRSGLSKAYLSRLENHKAPLSVDNLASISDALSVPIELFFSSTATQQPLVVTRKGKGKAAQFRGPHGFKTKLLAHGKVRKVMEPLLVEVESAKVDIPLQNHSGQEFDYVLKGSCALQYGNQIYTLHEGDSVFFDAEVPHAARPIGDERCLLLVVVGSNDYSFHGDLVRLLNER